MMDQRPMFDNLGEMRSILFATQTLDQWLANAPREHFPWSEFAVARDLIAQSEPAKAAEHFKRIANAENLETRHRLQAWNFLRRLGEGPSPELAKKVLGVVIEMGMSKGTDILAAYADHKARYVNYSGKAIIWERQTAILDEKIDLLLSTGSKIVGLLGSPAVAMPPPLHSRDTRISFLTMGGLYFGQGPTESFSKDYLSRTAMNAALGLLQLMIHGAMKG